MSPGRMSGVTPAQHAAPATPFTLRTPPNDWAPAIVLIVTALRMSSTSSVFASLKPSASMASFEGNGTMVTGSTGGSLMGTPGGVVLGGGGATPTAAGTLAVRAERRPTASTASTEEL